MMQEEKNSSKIKGQDVFQIESHKLKNYLFLVLYIRVIFKRFSHLKKIIEQTYENQLTQQIMIESSFF